MESPYRSMIMTTHIEESLELGKELLNGAKGKSESATVLK